MGNNNIVLVGFMATGKTTIGKMLAKTLDLDFIDMDQLIEEIEGITVNNIFTLNGEAYFREKEHEALDLFKKSENKVISTGGGIIISADNRRKLRDIGKVVYLESSPQWILTNLNRSETIRPLLNETNPIDKIVELLDKRRKYYEEVAEFKVVVDGKSLSEIVNNIISIIPPAQ